MRVLIRTALAATRESAERACETKHKSFDVNMQRIMDQATLMFDQELESHQGHMSKRLVQVKDILNSKLSRMVRTRSGGREEFRNEDADCQPQHRTPPTTDLSPRRILALTKLIPQRSASRTEVRDAYALDRALLAEDMKKNKRNEAERSNKKIKAIEKMWASVGEAHSVTVTRVGARWEEGTEDELFMHLIVLVPIIPRNWSKSTSCESTSSRTRLANWPR